MKTKICQPGCITAGAESCQSKGPSLPCGTETEDVIDRILEIPPIFLQPEASTSITSKLVTKELLALLIADWLLRTMIHLLDCSDEQLLQGDRLVYRERSSLMNVPILLVVRDLVIEIEIWM